MELERYIESLSEEEREMHKGLIDECRARVAFPRQCVDLVYGSFSGLTSDMMPVEEEETLRELESAFAE